MFSLVSRLISGRQGELSRMRPMTPEIISCNEFIRLFRDSNEATIQVSEQRIMAATVGMLPALQTIPYVKIRNRFRILSNLDPVINQHEETGIIRMEFTLNEVLTEFRVIARFAPGGESFILEKSTAPNSSA